MGGERHLNTSLCPGVVSGSQETKIYFWGGADFVTTIPEPAYVTLKGRCDSSPLTVKSAKFSICVQKVKAVHVMT